MRLTLRTLLAYLDDVLDPADKEELAKKIESSEFAEDLVHRTRDTVRRLRLSAPHVIGTGMGLDPNTVAEYLDNVMPPDAVGDFERICLESDVHLAEAAACHHVLTMILGQPADIDPLTRQRMYTIATEAGERRQLRVEPAHAMVSTAMVASPNTQPTSVAVVSPQSRAVEIPEYLRTGAWWRSWGALAGLAAIVVVGIAILFATGAPGWFAEKKSIAMSAPGSTPITENETPQTTAPSEQNGANTQNESIVGDRGVALQAPALGPPPQPLTPGISSPTQPVVTTKSAEPDRYPVSSKANDAPSAPPQTAVAGPATPAPAAAPLSATNPSIPSSPPTATNPPLGATSSPPTDPASPPSSASPLPGNATAPTNSTNPTTNIPATSAIIPSGTATAQTKPIEPAASAPPTASVATTGPAAASTVAALEANAKPKDLPKGPRKPPELGTYMGGKTVLLRYDGKTGAWFRVEPRAAVIAGERLLALPEFRPKIAFVAGPQLDMSGGTQVNVERENGAKPDDASAKTNEISANSGGVTAPMVTAGIPMLELVYGRIVLTNATNNDSRVKLTLGPTTGEAQLARNATLAVEVERMYVPGADPRKAPAPIECRLFAPDGGVVWKDGSGSKTIEKPSRWTVTIAGASEPAADPSPPEWIYREPIGQVSEQRYGAPKIDSTLVSNTPVDTQLLELFQSSKQPEVKSLVTKSSIHVGLFVPFVDALRDSEQKANWKTHINTLRSAMALSTDSANKVFQTLVEQRGRPAATDLFEMLCGYNANDIGHTPEQMKTGALAKLIDRLENDSLDYRVLAVQDLADITGKKLMSNPAGSLTDRAGPIRTWRLRLSQGQLKPIPPQK